VRPPPLIGVTTSITTGAAPERAYVNSAYLRAVQGAGGVPVLLPPQLDPPARDALWTRLDGLLLTGGGDLDPARFGETRHPTVYEVAPARDALELGLCTRAVDRALPLLAVCRGIQVLNVALGGSLYQDIASEPGSPIAHSQTEPRHQPTHAVKVLEGSRLAAVLGALAVDVNSFHHQALRGLGRGLRAVAWAPDGIVEGVDLPGAPGFVLGVQWHPEDLAGHDPAARGLFRALVDAAASSPR
jgi:putative glutamine amidotransferase